MNTQPLLAVASLALLAACATVPENAALVVPLAPSATNAGGTGQATLQAADGGTRIDLFFSNLGVQPTAPLQVYTYVYEGRCAQLPAKPAYALNDQVLVRGPRGGLPVGRRGVFTLSHQLPVPLAEVTGGRFALALLAAPQDGGELLYCGDLRS